MERPDTIILIHSPNMINTTAPISGVVRRSNYQYTWGIWQEYCMKYLNKKRLPMHYYYEFLDKDFVAYMGLDEYKPSYFLEDMIDNNIIKRKFDNSLLVMLGTNLQIDMPTKRFYEMLVMRILNPIFHRYNLDRSSVYIWDECLTDHFIDHMENILPNGYEYHPMLLWESVKLNRAIDDLYIKKQWNRYS